MPHSANSCYLSALRDGEITLIQSGVTTKQSILLSEVADIQIGIELQTIIEALTN